MTVTTTVAQQFSCLRPLRRLFQTPIYDSPQGLHNKTSVQAQQLRISDSCQLFEKISSTLHDAAAPAQRNASDTHNHRVSHWMRRVATVAKAAVHLKLHASMLIAWSAAGPPHMHTPTSNVERASVGGGGRQGAKAVHMHCGWQQLLLPQTADGCIYTMPMNATASVADEGKECK
jgi:hypothetical protein